MQKEERKCRINDGVNWLVRACCPFRWVGGVRMEVRHGISADNPPLNPTLPLLMATSVPLSAKVPSPSLFSCHEEESLVLAPLFCWKGEGRRSFRRSQRGTPTLPWMCFHACRNYFGKKGKASRKRRPWIYFLRKAVRWNMKKMREREKERTSFYISSNICLSFCILV